MRNAYEPAPWLAALNTPSVSATTGLGTGGGASVQTIDSGGFGEIFVQAGNGYSAAGSVSLTFPSAPPTLFIAGDDEIGALTQATVGNVVTISWTTASFPNVGGNSKNYKIHYEWETST